MTLELDELTHRYGSERALDDVTLALDDGELVALLGPSGCGKTTIVQAIAGHVEPTAGRVSLRGTDVTGAPPEDRNVGIVFQRSTLYPHMTVGENVAYGLKSGDLTADLVSERVDRYLELVELADRRDASPTALSGGESRRVELARALAPEPDVLLLDEPLSALDTGLRTRLRDEIVRIQQQIGVTTLFVTHDQEDAMSVADRIVVLREGAIVAAGEPRILYESPPNCFVASFLGRSNELSATIDDRDPSTMTVGGSELTLDEAELVDNPSNPLADASYAIVHVRPSDLTIRPVRRPTDTSSDADTPSDRPDASIDLRLSGDRLKTIEMQGTVAHVRDVGHRYDVCVGLDSRETVTVERNRDGVNEADRVTVTAAVSDLTVFPVSE
ncbi:ABC-type Fe3+/spermidine/putrescine transport system ATPase subunit [Halorubrum alkaliphilum]|uniref:Molybdate/tungstate import ATP-binding protein WtpC n=1 Tax=Halorubrum alkaliphilum TaxID=261290 RepID=A0A8T4GK53_9EURY|nr:ABC transporter ATP-binding protein [Halorubrum alkaliphilum]MBP1923771.1 ABC-type Fe3+/spermidine/putrescine transport system ATPase subunit [Halorubrum alkaliphilum]